MSSPLTDGGNWMNIAITFRQMDATEAMKAHATEKFGKLQKYLRQPMQAQITLGLSGRAHTVEAEVHSGEAHHHAHDETESMYASIDSVVAKLEAQIRAAKPQRKGAERASQRLLPDVEDEAD
ncbi:ribosome-associated translation inhibitor RaiA [bacterium]|nr:MAG: ribosome-associated translation inhibitor RaiA [bacterium]